MTKPAHHYVATLEWDASVPTTSYDEYSRRYTVDIEGKATLVGSADPNFRGDPTLHNPEDLLLAAIAGCHMLSYLALCARRRVVVTGYRDRAEGILELRPGGGGAFTEVTLRPRVTLAAGNDAAEALALHERAGKICFIAASCNFPIHHHPEVVVEGEPETPPSSAG